MAIEQLRTVALPQLAVADGATTPDPGGKGWAWSTTEAGPVHWDGTAWRAVQRRNKNPFLLDNATIACTRSGNAETFSLKTAAGADPSAADPVRVAFVNASGGFDIVERTSALSVTLSSGSTGGAIANLAFKVAVLLLNNAGTLEMAVVVRPSGIRDSSIVSTTAEGGAGGADSPRVIYSTTARTNVRCRVLGYATYTLATPGTWNTAPSDILLTRAGAVEIQAKELLYEKTLTANGVFDTNEWGPLPSGYDSFEIVASLRGSVSASGDTVYVWFNSDDTDANYWRQWGGGVNGSLVSTEGGGPGICSSSGATSVSGSFFKLYSSIDSPSGSDIKTAVSRYGGHRVASNAEAGISTVSWTGTSGLDAINRVRLAPDGYVWGTSSGDTFVSGSSLKLYGTKTMTVLS